MKKAIAYYYNKRAQSTAKHKTGRKKEKCQMKTSLILAEEKYTCKPDSQFFARETIGELRKSSRFLIVGLFSAVLRSWYPSSPPPTRVLRDVAKESKQPLNWDAQTQWWIFAYCCLYTKCCRSFNQTWHCSSEIAQTK